MRDRKTLRHDLWGCRQRGRSSGWGTIAGGGSALKGLSCRCHGDLDSEDVEDGGADTHEREASSLLSHGCRRSLLQRRSK